MQERRRNRMSESMLFPPVMFLDVEAPGLRSLPRVPIPGATQP